MTYIYTLSDGKQIRYVGKTKFITKRYNSHINESKNKRTYKEKWINKILLNGGKIIIEILDICDDNISDETESYWISQIKTWGFDLVNLTLGGDGGTPMKGKHHSEETKKKMSEKKQGIYNGTNNPNYVDGSSTYRKFAFENKEIKCEICRENSYCIVHHKDKNRKNNNLSNLMILCPNCHYKIHYVNMEVTENS